jgi:hypothetical protein
MNRGMAHWVLTAVLLTGTGGPQIATAQRPIVLNLGNMHQNDLQIQVGLKK